MEQGGGTRLGWCWRGLLLACALLCSLACGTQDAYQRVVLVTVTSLRSDHLGFAGYPRPTSPFLDELAARGAVFDRAYAASATGAISHATLFTGLEPHEHRVRSTRATLAGEVPTLAGRLTDRGYITAGFVSRWQTFEPRGLARGFDHFDTPPELAEHPYRSAERTVDAALTWLEGQPAREPLFLFVHLSDPGFPLSPPSEYVRLAAGELTGPDYYAFLEEEHGVPLGWYRWEYAPLNLVFNNYDAEVRFADTELRRLHDGLAALGMLDGTLLVVTSDHGLGLGNHFWDGSGRMLYEEQVRVPLLISATDGSVAARRVADVVSHQDLLPTLFELLGGPQAASGLTGSSGGRSLVPLLQGGGLDARPAFFDRGVDVPVSQAMENKMARSPIPPRPGVLVGGVDGRWKLLDHSEGADELYDLEADPQERENLLADGAAAPPGIEALQREVSERATAVQAAGS